MLKNDSFDTMYTEFDYIEDLQNPDVIQAVWEKGAVVQGYNPDFYRQDAANAWMARDAYGDKGRDLGWTIDHIYPVEKGGGNHFVNLRPMNWKNNIRKSDDYPRYTAAVTSQENRNIEKENNCTVRDNIQTILNDLYQ